MAKVTLRGKQHDVVFSTEAARRFEALTSKRVFDFFDDLAAKRVPSLTDLQAMFFACTQPKSPGGAFSFDVFRESIAVRTCLEVAEAVPALGAIAAGISEYMEAQGVRAEEKPAVETSST